VVDLPDIVASLERDWAITAGQTLRGGTDSYVAEVTAADVGAWLAGFIRRTWAGLGQPCSEEAVRQALDCAERRIAAHDSTRAVLVHGDVHEWNALAGTRPDLGVGRGRADVDRPAVHPDRRAAAGPPDAGRG